VQESLTETVTQDVSFANAEVWFSLHSANPGSTGLHEVTTGAGASGRQLVTFSGADGTDTNTAAVEIVISDVTVTWVGYWTTQESGTFLGGFPLVGAGTILSAAMGDTSLLCPSHGLSIDDTVRLYPMPGPAASLVPGGFSADTIYWVVASADVSHLELSATEGGSPITTGSAGACGMYVDESETSATGTLVFPAASGITYITTS
jgi:hypothetical protein